LDSRKRSGVRETAMQKGGFKIAREIAM